jgi:hypothetical protein
MAEEVTYPPRWKPRPPARLPGVNGKAPFEITVNELNSYLHCRRQWHITSANRQSLLKIGAPTPALHIGSAFHYATAMHSHHGQDPEQAVREFFSDSIERLQAQYLQRVGAYMSTQELNLIDEQRMMALHLIRVYYERHGLKNPIRPFKHIASEVTFRLPLVKEYDVWLVGTIDEIGIDPDGNPVPIERKTYTRKPDKKNWRFNHQIYGYACALSILTGKPVNYAAYDGIRKKEPTVPQLLKSGELSRKWIDTTYDVYKGAVLATYHGEVPIEFLDILNRLQARDQGPENAFTHRFRIPISRYAMSKWWDDAQAVAMEASHQPRIIPNFEWQGCPMCRQKDLCHAIQAGDRNAQTEIIRSEYRKGTTPTITTVRSGVPIAEKRVKDVSQLAKYSQVSMGHDPDYTTEVVPS